MELAVWIITIIFSGFLGLIVGSFINVVTIRYKPEDQNLKKAISGRSYCPHCQRKLAWFDLIPVLSFLFLRGKCRTCSKKISWQYPLVEIITSTVFVFLTAKVLSLNFFSYYVSSFQPDYSWIPLVILLWFFYAGIIITVSIIDLKHYILPDKIIFPAIIVAVLANLSFWLLESFGRFRFPKGGINFLGPASRLLEITKVIPINYLLGALVFSGFLFLIYLLSKGRAMGFGDVKLGIFLGLILGFSASILALAISFIIGAAFSVVAIVLKKKKFGQHVPFGPFLGLGSLVAILFGEDIINFYLSLIIF